MKGIKPCCHGFCLVIRSAGEFSPAAAVANAGLGRLLERIMVASAAIGAAIAARDAFHQGLTIHLQLNHMIKLQAAFLQHGIQ